MYRKSELVKTGIPFEFWLERVRIEEKNEPFSFSYYLDLIDLKPKQFDLLDKKGVNSHLNAYYKRHSVRKQSSVEKTRFAEIREILVQIKGWQITMAKEGNEIESLALTRQKAQTVWLNGTKHETSYFLRSVFIYSEDEFRKVPLEDIKIRLKTINKSLDYYPLISQYLEVLIFLKEDSRLLEEV